MSNSSCNISVNWPFILAWHVIVALAMYSGNKATSILVREATGAVLFWKFWDFVLKGKKGRPLEMIMLKNLLPVYPPLAHYRMYAFKCAFTDSFRAAAWMGTAVLKWMYMSVEVEQGLHIGSGKDRRPKWEHCELFIHLKFFLSSMKASTPASYWVWLCLFCRSW